jgi:ubiquitin carboxyl-terminal hydrolase 25/28
VLTKPDTELPVEVSDMHRTKACTVFAEQLAFLLSRMVLLDKKYTEPSSVLRALVDDFGEPLKVGEQKDIGEFNLNFLQRIEEGFGERVKSTGDDNLNFMEKVLEDSRHIDMMRQSSIIDEAPSNKCDTIFKLFFGKIVQILKVKSD